VAKDRTGAVFVILKDETADEISSVVLKAAKRVPEGRLLFAIWQVPDEWSANTPVESVFLTTMLGSPSERTDEEWEFYGTGAIRLYSQKKARPSTNVMWAAVRRVGVKAYLRIGSGDISDAVKKSSTIPVAHKVFTRDVANNVWHLRSQNGFARIVERFQFLTTWSDEVVLVYRAGRFTRRKHKALTFNDDLIPVAHKVPYELPEFPFAPTGKAKRISSGQIALF
jgi:hypothetical protein